MFTLNNNTIFPGIKSVNYESKEILTKNLIISFEKARAFISFTVPLIVDFPR